MSTEPAQLAVEMQGVQVTSEAPVLVLGPAIGTTSLMWHPLLPYLQDVSVVIYSHRGHGGSATPPGPYRIEELAGDVLAVMDQLGVETAVHVGDSLGGMIALQLATQAPERVQALAVIASSAHPGNQTDWLERAATVRRHGVAGQAEKSVGRWFTPEFAADPAARATRDAFLTVEPEGYAGCCEALAVLDLRPGLAGIRVPTLVIAGAQDEALPLPHSQAIADGVPGAQLVTIDDCAHLPPTQRPREVAVALRRFLGLQGT